MCLYNKNSISNFNSKLTYWPLKDEVARFGRIKKAKVLPVLVEALITITKFEKFDENFGVDFRVEHVLRKYF